MLLQTLFGKHKYFVKRKQNKKIHGYAQIQSLGAWKLSSKKTNNRLHIIAELRKRETEKTTLIAIKYILTSYTRIIENILSLSLSISSISHSC
jgi:hypothetical protein